MLSPLAWFVHERLVCKAPIPEFPRITPMVILPDGLGYRHLSEMRAAVCLILGPVFVLWQEGEENICHPFGGDRSVNDQT